MSKSTYIVIYPKPPGDEDLTKWLLQYFPGKGIGIAKTEDGEGFIPHPDQEADMTHVFVEELQGLWHWRMLEFSVDDAVIALEALNIFETDILNHIVKRMIYAVANKNPNPTGQLGLLLSLTLGCMSRSAREDVLQTYQLIMRMPL